MSGILYAVGAVTAVVGFVLVGFGIPVKEFSFGNTLIQAGVTTVVGGLVIAALGAVTAQLQRLNESLTAKSPIRSTRPMDMFDAARAARVPFPAKPKNELPAHEPYSEEPRVDHTEQAKAEQTGRSLFAPALRNPEESHVTVEDEVSLSPQHPAPRSAAPEASPQPSFERDEPEQADRHHDDRHDDRHEDRHDVHLDAGWRPAERPAGRAAQSNYFDAMWPSEAKDTKPASDRAAEDEYKFAEPKAEEPKPVEAKSFDPKRFEPKPFSPKPLFDPKPYTPKAAAPKFEEPKFEEPAHDEARFDEPKFDEPETGDRFAASNEREHEEAPPLEAELPLAEPVAILKSGVVDGMAYTLYVDGSIEAELPQGTLRFASINELRAHLEKSA